LKRRILKTVLYRVSTIGLVQSIYWAIFGTVELKFVIVTVAAQTIWYYIYDWLWERNRDNVLPIFRMKENEDAEPK